METTLHVLHVIHDRAPAVADPEALLERWSTVEPWARALTHAGAVVTVFLRSPGRDAMLERGGARLSFHRDAVRLHAAVHAACRSAPQGRRVLHVSGLSNAVQTGVLARSLPRDVAVIAQHHAEAPSRLRRPLQRWGLRRVDGLFFAARDLASGWIERGIIARQSEVFEIMEGSNELHRAERTRARARTGISGEPVLLWVGRLASLKDPLTVLDGFERVAAQVPSARLWMVYGESDLLVGVRDRIASSQALLRAVTLLGSVKHHDLEAIYNSADYFVLGSHHEGSGFALAEAMACGVVPVVTDIPSFRVMTDGGRIGGLWAAGEADAFARTFLDVMKQPLGALSDEAERFFHEHLSYPAIARDSIRAYERLLSVRR